MLLAEIRGDLSPDISRLGSWGNLQAFLGLCDRGSAFRRLGFPRRSAGHRRLAF